MTVVKLVLIAWQDPMRTAVPSFPPGYYRWGEGQSDGATARRLGRLRLWPYGLYRLGGTHSPRQLVRAGPLHAAVLAGAAVLVVRTTTSRSTGYPLVSRLTPGQFHPKPFELLSQVAKS